MYESAPRDEFKTLSDVKVRRRCSYAPAANFTRLELATRTNSWFETRRNETHEGHGPARTRARVAAPALATLVCRGAEIAVEITSGRGLFGGTLLPPRARPSSALSVCASRDTRPTSLSSRRETHALSSDDAT